MPMSFKNSPYFLCHHGIKGQHWGVRRFQNEDGTLTEEGRRRYIEDIGKQVELYNRSVDNMNRDLKKINKKYEKVDLNQDINNLEYTKEVVDAYKKNFVETLAKDMKTDPKTIVGKEWLNEMVFYNTSADDDVKELEKKVKKQKEKENKKNKQNDSKTSPNNDPDYIDPRSEKYGTKKMSSKKAISTAYSDLEKQYPNFNDLPLSKQDELFWNYINSSGLYRWM